MDWLSLALSLLCVVCNIPSGIGKVLELSDRFLEVQNEGAWFVMFYAPWCGHCKKLEPIWNQVSQSLYPPVVRVAQVDCTRFPNVASEFKVKGFPTLIFMKNGETFHYKGERTRETLVDYAERMALPPIQVIGDSNTMKNKINSQQKFFLYVGDNAGPTWEAFNVTAYEFQPYIYFYSVSLPVLLSSGIETVDHAPSVMVFKDGTHYIYKNEKPVALENRLEGEESETSPAQTELSNLRDWINHERFPNVVEISNGNFHQVMKIKKYIVLVVTEVDKVGRMPKPMRDYKDAIERFAETYHSIYHDNFLFGWTGSPELANSIAMTTLPVPSLIVINATNYLHHIPEKHMEILTPESLADFLNRILQNDIEAYGGMGVMARAKRMYYEGTTTLAGMWYGNPVLTSVIIGLPLGFLSLICYSMWCADIMDASEDDQNVREKED
ncbi:hypothetical protein GHT06_009207 [Daphnia sinensis]|uniref:Thioredoxin domain-containing protein n=1 Tax=Daphnia sinensis TaxID=1820382 RepID=A0AAD5LNP9_9CRUS|nr:hypothetical protein GHT06_009207 [Daphnia sinensis]